MEGKLSPESEVILAKLRDELPKSHLTEIELAKVRAALSVADGLGIMARFVIMLAALAAGITGLINFWPFGGR